MAEMLQLDESHPVERPTTLWWLTLGYAALGAFGWLTVAMQRLLYWRSTQSNIAQAEALNQTLLAQQGRGFAGSLLVDLAYALGTAAIFTFIAIAVSRRTWNAWDHATVAVGFLTVLSAVFLCAANRIMFWMPLSGAFLWVLLYSRGTKVACGVPTRPVPVPPPTEPIAALTREEIEREIAKERSLIVQLSQNLDVFEVERAMDTDVFVRRYTDGLEEENADNAEWFSIARAVRRSRERLQDLTAQLATISNHKA